MEDYADVSAILGFPPYAEGISPVEKLLNDFEAHEAKEDRALEFYKQTLAHLPNPATRFLLQLIVSDEEKHRAVIHAMAATLKGSLTWTKPAASLEGSGDAASLNGDLRRVTDELIDLEKAGIREYKALAKESSGYYHGLFKVLLDGMIRDSEKHAEMLEFLKESLKNS
jgi:rubrerythrin